MASFEDGLVSGDEAKKVAVARAKSVDEKTVSANKKDALETKVQGEIQDGWAVAKKNKSSVRMAKPKPVDRQLEDDVWTLLYKLGFKELNATRNFTIKLGENSPARQIDIFAKDSETVFIVECTHAQQTGPKSIKGLIDKINGLREDVVKAVHAHFGRSPKLKIKWAIATRNVDWRKADKDRAAEAGIAIISDHDIAYYTKLTGYLKEAARFQFLARYLQGEGVDGLKIEIPATKGSMGGVTFYNFLISPYDLLKISYISHKATAMNDLDTYQRMVKPARLTSLANYIDSGGQFPTNIVINFKTKKQGQLRFSKIQAFENSTFGTLTLPGQYGSAWVIDGQHRLYGFAFADRAAKHVIPVLAYENLPTKEEMRLFVDINCEQVKVSRSLLNEIYSNLNYGSEDPVERLEAQYSRIALRLDDMPSSPIRDRVVTVSKDKDNVRCLSLTSLADGIQENRFLGSVVPGAPNSSRVQPGPLSHSSDDFDLTTEKAADVLAGYFDLFAQGASANWQLGDAKGGFLCTNNGLRALLRLLKELITFFEDTDHVKAETMDAEDIVEKLSPYVAPLVTFFQNADPKEVQNFRSRQALDGVKKNCLGMMGIINDAHPKFTNKELKEYQESRDKEGTNLAHALIDEINLVVNKDVLGKLQQAFPDAQQWWLRVPLNTRKKCDEQWNNDGSGEKERWQYLSLADYPNIILDNWDLFSDRYDLRDLGSKGKKADKVSWINQVNKIRQTTHHPEKGLISKDEVILIQDIHAKVMQRIKWALG
jgi:DGQHR domain-containing protein